MVCRVRDIYHFCISISIWLGHVYVKMWPMTRARYVACEGDFSFLAPLHLAAHDGWLAVGMGMSWCVGG